MVLKEIKKKGGFQKNLAFIFWAFNSLQQLEIFALRGVEARLDDLDNQSECKSQVERLPVGLCENKTHTHTQKKRGRRSRDRRRTRSEPETSAETRSSSRLN